MAALRGTIRGDRSQVTRLSHRQVTARADTWHTFASVTVSADGSGTVTVRQNDALILSASFTAESAELPTVEVRTVGDPGHGAGVLA
jgi:hypothetical protein